jgi:O-antigen/teichoic acid export membrane protein
VTEEGGAVGKRVVAGAFWSLGGFGSAQIVRLIGNLVLTRLLFPEAFGIMAIVIVVLIGLELFSDIGFRPSVVQHSRGDDPDFLNTAWTLQILRGLLLVACCWAIAYPLGAFYAEPELPPLLIAASLSVLANSFASMNLFTASRHLRLAPLTVLEVGTQLASLVVMVGWALLWPSVWALLAGHVTWNALRSILSHVLLAGPRARLRWDPSAARELFHFGKWVFVSTAFTFLANEGDRLLFAKLVPFEVLGVYSVSVMLVAVPVMALGRLVMDVVFPAYSRVYLSGGDLPQAVRRFRGAVLTATGCIFSGIVVCGPDLVGFLYDDRYLAAGWMLQLLAMEVWFRVLDQSNTAVLLTLGEPNWVAAGHLAKVVAIAVMVPLGFYVFGFPGAIGAFALSEIWRYLVSTFAVSRHGIDSVGDAVPACTAVVACTAGLFALSMLPEMTPELVRLLVGGCVVLAAWSPLLLRASVRLREVPAT